MTYVLTFILCFKMFICAFFTAGVLPGSGRPYDPHSDFLQQSVSSSVSEGSPGPGGEHGVSPQCAQTGPQEGGGAGGDSGGESQE